MVKRILRLRFTVPAISLAVMLGLCLLIDAKPSFAQQSGKVVDADSIEANNQATQENLAKRIAADFQDTPLAEVFDFLSESLDIEIVARQRDLEEAGVAIDMPVTLKLKRVRGDMLLDLVIKQASPELGYVVRDGIAFVSSRSSLADQPTLRVYNCRDLLALPAVKTALKATSKQPAEEIAVIDVAAGSATVGAAPLGGSSGMSPAPGSMGGGMGGGGPARDRDPQAENLLQLIQSTVAAGTWTNDGGAGAIDEFRGLLVVNHSEEVHVRIEKLLQMLRAAAKEQPVAGEK